MASRGTPRAIGSRIGPASADARGRAGSLLQVSRQTLYDILAEKQDITPAMALWNGKLTGTTPEMWMNM